VGFLESGVHDGSGLLGGSESEIDHRHSFGILMASVEPRISPHNWCSKPCDVARLALFEVQDFVPRRNSTLLL
jgi:hypothetical protein